MELKYKNIVLEGMDGSSKQTQSNRLLERILDEITNDVSVVSFPDYTTDSGLLIREYLRNKSTTSESLDKIKDDSLLYTINRFETLKTLKDRDYFETEYTIFDRYTTSNMLYQTLDMSPMHTVQYITWLKNLEYNMLKLPKPDIVFALRVSPELSKENIKKRGLETDYFETLEVQRKVREHLAYLSEKEGWIIIDVDHKGAMRSIEDIHDEIFSHLIK